MSLDELVSLRRKEQKKTSKEKPTNTKGQPGKFSPGKKGPAPTTKTKRGPKATPTKPAAAEVAAESGKLKRQAAIAKRRGLATSAASPREIQTKARAAVAAKGQKQTAKKKTGAAAAKTTTTTQVTLKGRGVKKSPGKTASTAAAGKKAAAPGAGGQTPAAGGGVPKTLSIPATSEERPISIKDFVLPPDTTMTISFEPSSKKKHKTTAAATKQQNGAQRAAGAKSKNGKAATQTGAAARRATAAAKSKAARAAKVSKGRAMDTTDDAGGKRGPRGAARSGGGPRRQ